MTIDEVVRFVAADQGFTPAQIYAPTREKSLSWAKRYAIALARSEGIASVEMVSQAFRLDPSTIAYVERWARMPQPKETLERLTLQMRQ